VEASTFLDRITTPEETLRRLLDEDDEWFASLGSRWRKSSLGHNPDPNLTLTIALTLILTQGVKLETQSITDTVRELEWTPIANNSASPQRDNSPVSGGYHEQAYVSGTRYSPTGSLQFSSGPQSSERRVAQSRLQDESRTMGSIPVSGSGASWGSQGRAKLPAQGGTRIRPTERAGAINTGNIQNLPHELSRSETQDQIMTGGGSRIEGRIEDIRFKIDVKEEAKSDAVQREVLDTHNEPNRSVSIVLVELPVL